MDSSKIDPLLVRNLLAELRPYDAEGVSKIRIGPKGDGGYVLIDDDLASVDVLYSYGIGKNVRFDLDFTRRYGTLVRQYDHTIETAPKRHERFVFKREGITGSPRANCDRLVNHVKANGDQGKRMLLKIDTEGAEWDALHSTDEEVLSWFDQVVMEVHGLGAEESPAEIEQKIGVFQKLNRLFSLCHVHANNWAWVRIIGEYKVPESLELTYLRKKDGVSVQPSATVFPTKYDSPCRWKREEIKLDFWPFLQNTTYKVPRRPHGRVYRTIRILFGIDA